MPHLYSHKRHGWQIVYRIFFPDGTYIKRTKYRKRKQDAWDLFHDADKLEIASRKRSITKEECIFAKNIGLINADEAGRLAGSHVSPYRTWDEIAKQYEIWAKGHYRSNTCYVMVNIMHQTIQNIAKPPADITKEDVLTYIVNRKMSVKATTINKEIIILRTMLDFYDPISNPARKVRLLKRDDERLPRPFSPGEIEKFMDALDRKKHLLKGYITPLVYIALYAGLRPSEIINLTPADIDLRNNKIYVQAKENYQTKTGKARSIAIHPDLKPHLISLSGKYVIGGDHQFDTKVVSHAITKVIRDAGLEGVTPYCLRHSFVTYLLQSGATVREVMDLAGHRLLGTVLRYLHVVPDQESPVLKIDFGSRKRSK